MNTDVKIKLIMYQATFGKRPVINSTVCSNQSKAGFCGLAIK